MKSNNKGFTLIELIATIVILGIVASIGSYAITEIIKSSKKNNLNLLKNNIQSAAEMLYQDCKYVTGPSTLTNNECYFNGGSSSGYLQVSLGKLVDTGYLTSNSTKEQSGKLYNPETDEEISSCIIKISMSQAKINVEAVTQDDKCPK